MNSFSARFPRVARYFAMLCAAFALHSAALAQPTHWIDLSLNLIYDDENDPNSGGTWQVAAKTSHHGLANVAFYLQDVVNNELPTLLAPRGNVNGGAPGGPNAGFKNTRSLISLDGGLTGQYMQVYQQPPVANTLDQPLFYGVGSVVDPEGAVPNFPGAAAQFPDASFIGPSIPTLSGLENAPWGNGDVFGDDAWAHAALLLTGSFDPGQTPSFITEGPGNLADPAGTVFVTLPANSTLVGTTSAKLTPTFFVRDNLITAPGTGGDYNGDGIVNLADYTVWRDALGATVAPPGSGADGDNSGTIDAGDYTVWKDNFGLSIPPLGGVSAGPVAVPEPSALMISTLAMASLVALRGRRVSCES